MAVEVLSPGNTAASLHAKVADYLAAGTRFARLVDTGEERIEVYRSLLAPRTLRREDTLSGEDVVPGFTASVGEILDPYSRRGNDHRPASSKP